MHIGKRLKAWRDYRSLSQGELAERAGYKQAQISDIETGKQKSIHPNTKRKLADALGLTVEEFAQMPPGGSPGEPEPVKRPELEEALKGRVTIDLNGVEVELTEEEKAKILAMAKILKGGG